MIIILFGALSAGNAIKEYKILETPSLKRKVS